MSFDRHRSRLDASPFAVLATHGLEDRLDLVPCCFAVDDGGGLGEAEAELVTAVDHKPKRTKLLARLANIERTPAVSLLVDHRDADDWSQLWWVRAHGSARIVNDGEEYLRAIDALCDKYPQYRQHRPDGAVIRIKVDRWAGWTP